MPDKLRRRQAESNACADRVAPARLSPAWWISSRIASAPRTSGRSAAGDAATCWYVTTTPCASDGRPAVADVPFGIEVEVQALGGVRPLELEVLRGDDHHDAPHGARQQRGGRRSARTSSCRRPVSPPPGSWATRSPRSARARHAATRAARLSRAAPFGAKLTLCRNVEAPSVENKVYACEGPYRGRSARASTARQIRIVRWPSADQSDAGAALVAGGSRRLTYSRVRSMSAWPSTSRSRQAGAPPSAASEANVWRP